MTRLSVSLGSTRFVLLALFFASFALALKDEKCEILFSEITNATSPWLWTGYIENFNVERWIAHFDNATITSNLTVTEILSLFPGSKPFDLSYPEAISYAEVHARCGYSGGFYSWQQISDTLTTWILPIIGLIVQMPWESNHRFHTMLMIFRWMGSPFASLTYILWNIRVMARCATMVDLACPAHFTDTDEESMFAKARDSFSILAVMNQYKVSDKLPMDEEELRRHIRIALFGTDMDNGVFGLDNKRKEVAAELRRLRKRGVVPVLISLLWFLVALAISIYQAFADVGDNATAHNLALGLLVGWLPVLVTASIVDRNSVDSEHCCKLLNQLMRRVHPYDGTFTKFVGQGRSRWHYGVAHGLVLRLESGPQVRPIDWHTFATSEIPDEDRFSLIYFSKWEYVHMFLAWLALGMSVLGAFYISYNTPTVGLGCRSFSYVIYLSIATFTGSLELILYPLMYRPMHSHPGNPPIKQQGLWAYLSSKRFRSNLNTFLYIIDFISAIILFTILFMQTTGGYNTYFCKSSQIGGKGGYIVFNGTAYVKTYFNAETYWMIGSIISSAVPCLGITYCVRQWLTQSFLWSSDIEKARRGLFRVRRWKMIGYTLTFKGFFKLPFLGGLRWRP